MPIKSKCIMLLYQSDYQLRSEEDNVFGSVRLFVCVYVCQQRAKKSHQSEVFFCLSNNQADAVNRLLIYF